MGDNLCSQGHDCRGEEGACLICGRQRVSDPDATIDRMVERASRPSLATLFQRGKAAGLIQPATEYGHDA